MYRWLWQVGLLFGGIVLWTRLVHAEDTDHRVALLIAHQQGWKNDPPLRYAVQGDLQPMARMLGRFGFRTKVVTNPNAAQFRRALRWANQRVQRAPRVQTFLFYYTGHADRNHLHLGRRGKNPVGYNELVQFFRRLPVKRRIVFLDACFSGEIIRQFGSLSAYKKLVRKGARGIRPLDLSRSFPNQGEEQGLQVISSSLNYSWESRKYKASIFTHHLLEGLRGPADRDSDGRISVNELFNFVSDSMTREIKQKPIMFGVIRRVRPYALAPAYHSRLWIGSSVVGKLRVSVANFYWSRHKQGRRPLRLSVVHGRGFVQLERSGQCWQQNVLFPKGGEARLRSSWRPISCESFKRVRKGSLSLEAPQYTPPPAPRVWSIEALGGVLGSPVGRGDLFAGGMFGLHRRYFGLQLGVWGTSSTYSDAQESQLLLDLRIKVGYQHRWGWFSLFAGGYTGVALLWQNLLSEARTGPLFQYGLNVQPTFWLSPNWGLAVHVDVGFTLGQYGPRLENIFRWSGLVGIRYKL